MLSTSVSGLLAFQRALDTTSHNIANVSTPGYSRQEVQIGTRPAQPAGNGWIGQGATVQTTRRLYDDFIAQQTRTTSSSFQHLDVYSSNAARLDDMFGNSTTGLSTTLQDFVNAFQSVANSPNSIPARQVLLSQASTLQNRLQSFDSQLNALDSEVNSRLSSEVADLNTIAGGIAKLNSDIQVGLARTGQPPNDLLDQRDQLLDQLAEKVSVNVVKQDDGVVNVFIGNGQPLVVGANANKLTTVQDEFDPTKLGLALGSPGSALDVTRNISGGVIGGLLDFRQELLDPAHNELGRITAALVEQVNSQHAEGMDLNGAMGSDFFAVGDVQILDSASNSGTGTVSVTRADVTALTSKDYVLQSTGGGWQLRDAKTGAAVTMTGSGTVADPFVADGMQIVVGGAPANGDEFLIQPTRTAIAGLDVLVTDPSKVAAAAPIRGGADPANDGSGTISVGEVLDASNAALRNTTTIEFLTPTTYSINGAGSFAYTPGSNIDLNGWRVQISGSPAVGDTFTVSNNTSGSGDNRNALALSNALQTPVLNNSTTSLGAGIGQFVGSIGVATHQAQVNRDAQSAILDQNVAAQDSVSGVNLDEEAANLLKYQQAYQAAAQLIRVADTLFQSLLSATQR
jgi:flagellar hook-associated protein 1 FlgK